MFSSAYFLLPFHEIQKCPRFDRKSIGKLGSLMEFSPLLEDGGKYHPSTKSYTFTDWPNVLTTIITIIFKAFTGFNSNWEPEFLLLYVSIVIKDSDL